MSKKFSNPKENTRVINKHSKNLKYIIIVQLHITKILLLSNMNISFSHSARFCGIQFIY